jgi:phosphatidate phosphatase APP1
VSLSQSSQQLSLTWPDRILPERGLLPALGRFLAMLVLLSWPVIAAVQTSTIKDDYEVVFFPSVAHLIQGGKKWEFEVHGCVYENNKHRFALAILREALELDRIRLNPAEIKTFNERARLFMVEDKGGKQIVVKIAGRNFVSTKTKPDGHFSMPVKLSEEEAKQVKDGQMEFQAVLSPKDKRVLKGSVRFAPDSGITVISDIDDTVKITRVHDYKATLRSTFLEPFKPVPGMAALYRSWATNEGARFFYVSASPWQLFLPLSDFVHANGFPEGAFYLKDFRLKDRSLFTLFESPEKYKPVIIQPLLKLFTERQFVLVGDSGERDPEIYGELARHFRGQVRRILIRDVTGESTRAARYQQAFRDLPAEIWTIFHEPSEIGTLKLTP